MSHARSRRILLNSFSLRAEISILLLSRFHSTITIVPKEGRFSKPGFPFHPLSLVRIFRLWLERRRRGGSGWLGFRKNRHWNHGLRSLNPRIEAFMHNSWPRLPPLLATRRLLNRKLLEFPPRTGNLSRFTAFASPWRKLRVFNTSTDKKRGSISLPLHFLTRPQMCLSSRSR